jgi:type I restriction enzyme S subunit
MNAERLLAQFERISEAPDAIARLRRFILDLAVRGKLLEQDPEDEPAEELLEILSSRSRKEGPKNQSKQPDSSVDSFIPHPRGWALASFNRVALIRSNLVDPALHPEKPHIAPDCIEGWTAKLMNFQTVGESGVTSPKHLFRPGVILYSKIRPNLAKAAKVDFGGLCSADMYPIESLINRDYLLKYMISGLFVVQATAGDNRVAMPKINQAALNQILVPVPPLTEQHRIVAKVDELMALCDQLEAARQHREQGRERLVAATLQRLNQPAEDPASYRQDASFALQVLPSLTTTPAHIKQLRQTILNLAVRGKLVEQDLEDEPAEEQLERIALAKLALGRKERAFKKKKSDMSIESFQYLLPSGWASATLADLVTILNGRAYKQSELLDSGTPVLRVGNLFTSNKWFYSNLELDDDKCIDDGDLIFAWSASFGPFIWKGGRVIYHYHIWKLPLHSPADLSLDYLHLYLLHKTAEIKGAGHGISMVHMTKEKMEGLDVPLPPLAEQHRIVAKVEELMALCDQLEQQLNQADQQRRRLLEAVLAEALGGRLTAEEDSHANAA